MSLINCYLLLIVIHCIIGDEIKVKVSGTKGHWYESRGRALNRNELLGIAFVIKDILPKTVLTQMHITRNEFETEKFKINQDGTLFLSFLSKCKWQTIRSVVKAMTLKFWKEPKNKKYDEYIALARGLWRESFAGNSR